MIREWYSARELAELTLPGMPGTERAFQLKAKKDEWKHRLRAAGKGLEYHIKNLPEAAQMALVERLVGTENLEALRGQPGTDDAPEPKKKQITNDDRRHARIIILALYEKFMGTSGLSVIPAERPFLKFYAAEGRAENSKFVPGWVYQIYPEFSVQTLRRWRAMRKHDSAYAELSTKYGKRRGTGILDRANDGEVSTFIVALITKHLHVSGAHVRDLTRSRFGDRLRLTCPKTGQERMEKLPNIRTFERFVYNWKQKNGDLHLKLTNPDGFKNRHQVAFGKADAGIERLNQIWEIDASPVDALCVDGRYSLYACIDVFSRRTIILVTKTPRTEATLLLIRRAIMEWGVPESIRTDQCSDFTSKRFQVAIASLGIEHAPVTPFSPEKKPFVERVIGTIQSDVMPILPGFIGHSVADRKMIEATKAFSVRLGEDDKSAFAVKMTSEELQRYLDDWAFSKYAHSHHGTIGMSPFEKANSWRGNIRKIDNPRALDLLLAPIATGDGYRTVTKKGIKVERADFIAPELGIYIGKKLLVRHDPVDMGRIYLFDAEENFICEAFNPERLGIDRDEMTALAKAKKKQDIREREKEIKRMQRSIKPEDLIQDYLRAHVEKSADVVSFPRQADIHTSPALAEAAKAMKPRGTAPAPAEQTERQKKSHEALLLELSGKAPPAPVKETPELRFKRAMNFEARLERGERISEEDYRWLEGYRNTPQYRTQKAIREDFGPSWFEEKGETII